MQKNEISNAYLTVSHSKNIKGNRTGRPILPSFWCGNIFPRPSPIWPHSLVISPHISQVSGLLESDHWAPSKLQSLPMCRSTIQDNGNPIWAHLWHLLPASVFQAGLMFPRRGLMLLLLSDARLVPLSTELAQVYLQAGILIKLFSASWSHKDGSKGPFK